MKYIILFFLFTTLSIFSEAEVLKGSWFSKQNKFMNGHENFTIYFQKSWNKNKFILAKISFNQEKKWEETRISGIVEVKSENSFELKPESCLVYATKKLGARWILFRSVDCEHLSLSLSLKENHLELFNNPIGLKENLILEQIKNSNLENIQAIIIKIDGETIGWGLEIRKLKKNAEVTFNSTKLDILEKVDSTLKVKYNEDLRLNDIIQIYNKDSSSLFD